MNYSDTEDNEIEWGDEANLTPIEDLTLEANDDSNIESTLELVADPNPSPEVVDTPSTVDFVEDEAVESQPQEVIDPDWQSPAVEEELVPAEIVSDVPEPVKVQSQLTGWQSIWGLFAGNGLGRLNNLTQAIEDAPESPVNYVLRAELYMNMREYALAQADFQRAYELAEIQFELADWGLLDQVMRDRALAGLEKVQHRL